jgi:hypothetical protein
MSSPYSNPEHPPGITLTRSTESSARYCQLSRVGVSEAEAGEAVGGVSDCGGRTVYGTPQVVALAPDRHEDLVQVPHVTQLTLSIPEPPSVLGSELPTPLPHGLVADHAAPLGQELLDIAESSGRTGSTAKPCG